MISRMSTKTGETVRSRGMMYKAVEESVIMYCSESWVVMGEMLKLLEGFHHQESIQIMGKTGKRAADEELEYPPVVVAIEASGLHTIQEYILRRQATIVAHVVC